MIYRAFIHEAPGSKNCPPEYPNGCYNTGRVDTGAVPGTACANPDAQQFADRDGKSGLQWMIEYAASKGETIRQFNSEADVAAVCGASPIQSAPTPGQSVPTTTPGPPVQNNPGSGSLTSGGGYVQTPGPNNTCGGGVCGGSSSGGGVPSGGGIGTSPGGTTTNYVPGGGSSFGPGSRSLTGGSSGGTTSASTTAATSTTPTTDGFSLSGFIKGPFGIMTAVLVVVIGVLAFKG